MLIFKKIITALIIVFVTGISVHSVTEKKILKNNNNNTANILLYNVSSKIDLFEYWVSEYKADKNFEEKIIRIINNEIFTLSTLNPDIQKLQGTPLKALNRLIKVSNTKSFNSIEHERVFTKSLNYLSSIEMEVENTLKDKKLLPEFGK